MKFHVINIRCGDQQNLIYIYMNMHLLHGLSCYTYLTYHAIFLK